LLKSNPLHHGHNAPDASRFPTGNYLPRGLNKIGNKGRRKFAGVSQSKEAPQSGMPVAGLPQNEICMSELFTNGVKNLMAAQVLFRESLLQEIARLETGDHRVFQPERPKAENRAVPAVRIVQKPGRVPKELESIAEER
jgi:hypothetical protein